MRVEGVVGGRQKSNVALREINRVTDPEADDAQTTQATVHEPL